MNTEKLCDLIQTQRKELKFSLEKLARKIEISTYYLGDIEHDRAIPSLEILAKLSTMLQIPVDRMIMLRNRALNNPEIRSRRGTPLANKGKFPNPDGRPAKLTPEVHAIILQSVRETNNITAAGQRAGVHPDTVREWLKRGRDAASKTVFRQFYLDVEKARGAFVFEIASRHHRLAKGGIVQKPRLKVIETERGFIRTTQVEHDAEGRPIMEDHYIEPNLSAIQWELTRAAPENYGNPDKVRVTNVNNNQVGERLSLLQVLNFLGEIPDDDASEH